MSSTPIADALEEHWTADKFFQGDFTNLEGTKFCIIGLYSCPTQYNPLSAEVRHALELLDLWAYYERGIILNVINDRKGREAVIDQVRKLEEWRANDENTDC